MLLYPFVGHPMPSFADSCIKACLRAGAMLAMSRDRTLKQSKSSRSGLCSFTSEGSLQIDIERSDRNVCFSKCPMRSLRRELCQQVTALTITKFLRESRAHRLSCVRGFDRVIFLFNATTPMPFESVVNLYLHGSFKETITRHTSNKFNKVHFVYMANVSLTNLMCSKASNALYATSFLGNKDTTLQNQLMILVKVKL
ncbi:hypothetical protein NQ317_007831 [Molorchus minor]|uniref:Uncharacterized protein n=1 Tax=Molorchus minor TaxID=1323400 RepID=A0ABQ9K2W4_9CUCU|nr:hypothetical protein NQ317_007831 [Molorchus minor]